jgi:polyferredoxin
MARIGRPPELITLDTERNQARRARGEPPATRIIRPRTLVYGSILALIAAGTLIGLTARAAVEVNLLHDRNPLFVTLSDGSIRNGYTIKVLNKTHEERQYDVAIGGPDGATLSVLGEESEDAAPVLSARPDAVATYRAYVTAPPGALAEQVRPLTFRLQDRASGAMTKHETVFRGP